ncbi:MAG: DUF4124 domain-containing protein, partial [Betaproteobacteria bacterium]
MASLNHRSPVLTGLLVLPLVVFAANASAQLYKWTDENGKVHYSDTVPPSATDRARKEMRPDGTVKKQVDRALTQEERRIAAAKAAEDEKERIAREERERKDRALLSTYTSLVDFDRVRDRALTLADGELTALRKQEASTSAAREALQKQADTHKKGPPLKLKSDVFRNQLRVHVWFANFLNVHEHFVRCHSLYFLFKRINTSTFF